MALWEACLSEPQAQAVLVTGAAGVGKTRLRQEFLRRLSEEERVEVWIGRGDPLRAGSPFGMLAPALRRAAGILDDEPIEVRRRKLRARLSRHITGADLSRISEFLGELVACSFPDSDSVQLRAARQDPRLMADQIRRAFEDFATAECRERPLVLVLDDLHWGDLPSVKLLEAALLRLQDRPLFILALARSEIHDLFPGLWERWLQEVRLRELSRKAAESLVREALGEVSLHIVERIVARAAGNAFFLEELVRAVAEGRESEVLPETVLAVVQSRLEALPADARRVLRAASVFGQVFWESGVLVLLGEPPGSPLTEWLDELVRRELIIRRQDPKLGGEPEYVFRHSYVRDGAYAMLTPSDRTLGHKLAGEWLERAGERDAHVLAGHFERGGEREEAIRWWRRAAEQALGGDDLTAVLDRAGRAIALGARGEILGALRLLEAEAHEWRGGNAEVVRAAGEAMQELRRGTSLWYSALGRRATAVGRQGERAQLAALVDELESAVPAPEAQGAYLVATTRLAVQLMHAGNVELGGGLLEHIAEREDLDALEPVEAAAVYTARAWRALYAGDTAESLLHDEQATRCLERAGDLRGSCQQRAYGGYEKKEMGAYLDAEADFREAIATGERLGLSSIVALARHNLGFVLAELGRVTEGIEAESQALAAFRAQGDRRLEAACQMYLARILLVASQPKRALEPALDAVQLCQELPPFRAYALAMLARVHLALGMPEAAREQARLGLELLESLGGIDEGESLVRLVWAEALYATGDRGAAEAAIALAAERLLERAAKIGDPTWRDRFLQGVPENARTLELARAWSSV
jgi:predicted ATPase